MAGSAILTAILFHNKAGDPDQTDQFQKNLAIAGGFLVLAANGAGAWSLDGWLAKRPRRRP